MYLLERSHAIRVTPGYDMLWYHEHVCYLVIFSFCVEDRGGNSIESLTKISQSRKRGTCTCTCLLRETNCVKSFGLTQI